jgi:hypothetical protein
MGKGYNPNRAKDGKFTTGSKITPKSPEAKTRHAAHVAAVKSKPKTNPDKTLGALLAGGVVSASRENYPTIHEMRVAKANQARKKNQAWRQHLAMYGVKAK